MNCTIKSVLSVLVALTLIGCGDTSDSIESNTSDVEKLPVSSVSSKSQNMPYDDASIIKPLQIITNMQELNALYDILQPKFRFDEEDIDFTKDLILVIKRFQNDPYKGIVDLINDGNKTIEIRIDSAEITAESKDANASIRVMRIVNAFNKPIYLTKVTRLMDPATKDIRTRPGVSYAVGPIEPSVTETAFVTSKASRRQLMPFRITDTAGLETYATTFDFNISQLRFNEKPFLKGNIMSSGYYVAANDEAFFDRPVLDMISKGDEIYVTTENNTSDPVSYPNYHFYFEIHGVRHDCKVDYPEWAYPNARKALFYRFDPDVPDATEAHFVSYYTAQQTIYEKSCTDLRTANLDELGEWISKRTWQQEE